MPDSCGEHLEEGRKHFAGMSSTTKYHKVPPWDYREFSCKSQEIQSHPPERGTAGDLLYCRASEPRESPLTSEALPAWSVARVVHL